MNKAAREIYTGQLAEMDTCCEKLLINMKDIEKADNLVADKLWLYQKCVERVKMSMDELRDRMCMVQRLCSRWP